MRRRPRAARAESAGQALLEFALMAPLLILMVFTTADLARNYGTSIAVVSTARVGMLTAMRSNLTNVGAAVTAAASDLPATATVWGAAAPGGPDDCSNALKACGDPQGCITTSLFWSQTSPAPVACFAVGQCSVDAITQPVRCASQPSWNQRPGSNTSTAAIVVRVVVEQQTVTPIVGQFFPGNSIVVLDDLTALPAY